MSNIFILTHYCSTILFINLKKYYYICYLYSKGKLLYDYSIHYKRKIYMFVVLYCLQILLYKILYNVIDK